MNTEVETRSYVELLQRLKQEISRARIKAHLAVNKEMISLYWNIGKHILERQDAEGWGSKIIERISNDLRSEYPEMTGLSARNLVYMQTFARIYPDFQFTQQAAAQIPWGHNCVIMDKVSGDQERRWYAEQTIENGWSRNVLSMLEK